MCLPLRQNIQHKMSKKELIEIIRKSNIPAYQKQEIIGKIKHTADPGQIALIFIELFKLGLDVLSKFPPL